MAKRKSKARTITTATELSGMRIGKLKIQPIDLGGLQTNLQQAKKDMEHDNKALERAREAAIASKKKYQEAHADLKAAAAAILE
jgi:hypothetical protein